MRSLIYEDWLNDLEFWSKKNRCGNFVLNDSENYTNFDRLVLSEVELNKIFLAQQLAYNYVVGLTMMENERGFIEQLSKSPSPKDTIQSSINSLENHVRQQVEIYDDVMRERTYRNMPYGAKFLLPAHYQKLVNGLHINGYFLPTVEHMVLDNNGNIEKIELPSAWQRKYIETAINVQ